MKRSLRTLFYGVTHEHAPGKLETLKRLRETYEIVAIADDRPATPCFFQTDPPVFPEGVPVVGEDEAMAVADIDVVFIETVDMALPVAEVAEAHAILERGENHGKVVMTI